MFQKSVMGFGLAIFLMAQGAHAVQFFKRGDVNGDNIVNVSDVIYLNNYLYRGGPSIHCMDAADFNNDGQVAGADSAFLLDCLFNGGACGANFGECVADSGSSLGCAEHPCN